MTPDPYTDPPQEQRRAAIAIGGNDTERITAAERASAFATHGDPSARPDSETADARGKDRATVEWVRSSQAAARAGSAAATPMYELGRSAQDALYAAVREATQEQSARLRERLAQREAQVTIEDSNRTGGRMPATRQGVGR